MTNRSVPTFLRRTAMPSSFWLSLTLVLPLSGCFTASSFCRSASGDPNNVFLEEDAFKSCQSTKGADPKSKWRCWEAYRENCIVQEHDPYSGSRTGTRAINVAHMDHALSQISEARRELEDEGRKNAERVQAEKERGEKETAARASDAKWSTAAERCRSATGDENDDPCTEVAVFSQDPTNRHRQEAVDLELSLQSKRFRKKWC
jgi:hypothetical protein